MISDWHLVVKIRQDDEESQDGEVIGAYPFPEVAERVIDAWFAEQRHKTLGELCDHCQYIGDGYWLDRIRRAIDDPDFSFPGPPEDFALKNLTKETMIALLRAVGGEYLEVRRQ